MTRCKWCEKEITGNIPNHVRWCKSNPRIQEYLDILQVTRNSVDWVSVNKGKSDDIKAAHRKGRYKDKNIRQKGKSGTPHTEETKSRLRKLALESGHRRLVKSCRNYSKKDGTVVKLDSSWEEALATRLDELDIKWVRPNPIKWIDDNGVYHNYFPDFYLGDFDLYLDPKNPHAAKVQKHKLGCLSTQIKNLIIITTLEECKKFTPDEAK